MSNYRQLSPIWREILLDLYENLGQTKTDSILFQIGLPDSIALGRFEHPFLHCCNLASEYLSEIFIGVMQGKSEVGDLIVQLFKELETENNQYLFPYALTEIAGIYSNEGYLVQSRDLLSAALNLSKQYENMGLCEFVALRSSSVLYLMGEYEKAAGILSYWDNADYTEVNNYIEAQLLLSNINQAIDDYDKASHNAMNALEAYDSNRDMVHYSIKRSEILTRLGRTYVGLNQFDEAQKCYDEAITAYNHKEEQHGSLPPLSLYTDIAVLAFEKGDYATAKAGFSDLLETINKWSLSSSWIYYQYLCEISIKQGDYESAAKYLDQMWRSNSDEVLGLFNTMTENERETYWRTTSNMVWYYGIRALQTEPALNSPFFNIVLSNKGQLINTNLSIENNVRNSNNQRLIDSYQAMKTTRNAPDSVRYLKAKQFIELYSSEFDQNDLIIKWQDIQNKLSRNECVIEFVNCQDRDNDPCIGALILKKTYKIPALIKLCDRTELEEIFKQGKNMYSDESMVKMYDLVWQPLEPYLNLNDIVYFSPDDLLHLINIEILCDHNGDRVCDKYKLHRISSSRQICIKKKKVKYSSMAIYGGLQYEMSDAEMIAQNQKYSTVNEIASRGFVSDTNYRAGWKYLLGTKEEASIISDNMKKRKIDVLVYYGTEGTEESFKSLSSKNIQIIHLATHGFFFKNEETKGKAFFENQKFDGVSIANNRLKRSGLVMAGGQRAWLGDSIPANVDDGILLAEEIAAMNLSGTDLVVLSACETGLGDITSDGVFGLQRAFKMAGVQTLVMSLWKVDDNATSLMMQTFYEHLLSGLSKREAFNFAQAAVRAKYPEPYYWAGFVMLD